MTDQEKETKLTESALGLIEQLSSTGFFDQIRELDTNIKRIVGDLEVLGGLATQRVKETENLAAHLLAIEAILAVILKTHPVDAKAVQAAIREMSEEAPGDTNENQAVQSIVESLLPSS